MTTIDTTRQDPGTGPLEHPEELVLAVMRQYPGVALTAEGWAAVIALRAIAYDLRAGSTAAEEAAAQIEDAVGGLLAAVAAVE